MAKKLPKIKIEGTKPEKDVVKAKVPNTATSQIMGQKISFNHRTSAVIETDLKVEVEAGYKLCFSLVPELSNRGMIATNSPGNFTNGTVHANLLNVGREIVEVKTGDPLMTVWLEQIIEPEWVIE